jgi:metal-responsive CopG/Arc/MetJ family transcriptional regulator
VVLVQEEIKVGRPSLGITKKVSITLPEDIWQLLDLSQEEAGFKSRSELFREMILRVIEISKYKDDEK